MNNYGIQEFSFVHLFMKVLLVSFQNLQPLAKSSYFKDHPGYFIENSLKTLWMVITIESSIYWVRFDSRHYLMAGIHFKWRWGAYFLVCWFPVAQNDCLNERIRVWFEMNNDCSLDFNYFPVEWEKANRSNYTSAPTFW